MYQLMREMQRKGLLLVVAAGLIGVITAGAPPASGRPARRGRDPRRDCRGDLPSAHQKLVSAP